VSLYLRNANIDNRNSFVHLRMVLFMIVDSLIHDEAGHGSNMETILLHTLPLFQMIVV